MSEVVERLAELTGFRDRDMLDVSLVGAFRDLLRPQRVAIYRAVGESGSQRWLTRARLGPHETSPSADPLWTELEQLPRLEEHPLRLRCHSDRCALVNAGAHGRSSWFPLLTDSAICGVLEIESEAALQQEDTNLVSSVLRVYKNLQSLLDYSERDTLTGLLNRKTFDEAFLRSAARAAADAVAASRLGQPTGERRGANAGQVWLGVIDIDHFKAVNDNFGHLIGDEVLLLLARLMRTSFRYYDQLYRFGGEEFVVLLVTDKAEHAQLAFERLRANVARYQFPRVQQLSVSIGFTGVRPGDTPAAAFERADKAVYHAKRIGRNCVVHHADLVANGTLVDERRTGDVVLF